MSAQNDRGKNGPKAKNIEGVLVVSIPQSIINVEHICRQNKSIYAHKGFRFFKDKDSDNQKGQQKQYYVEKSGNLQMFPVGHGASESTQAHRDIHIHTHAHAQT